MKFDIKDARLHAGLSQAKLAKQSGVKQQSISLLEQGRSKSISVISAVKIANVLGVTVESLVK